jgi:hypothetical protein
VPMTIPFREDDFRNRLRLIHREMTRRERQHLSKGVVPIASSIVPVELTAERSQEDLAFLLGEDNDD